MVTIDAMCAQREICQQILDQGGDYVISLKGNHNEPQKNCDNLVTTLDAFILENWILMTDPQFKYA